MNKFAFVFAAVRPLGAVFAAAALVLPAARACAQAPVDTVYRQDLPAAERIADLHFSEAQDDTLYEGVENIHRLIERQHAIPLDNSIPPTLWESPVLPGMTFGTIQKPVHWKLPAHVSLPAHPDDLAFYSIPQLASLLRHKKITSVALTRFFIDRLRKFGDTLHCVIELTEDLALEEAREADSNFAAGRDLGPLQGIPYGLKDLFAVSGTRTTWGAAPYKDQVIHNDATVFKKLHAAGAVLIAKLSLGALAMGDWWFDGQTRDPWNLKVGSSGSSAGPAAATVAGLVPFAIGTETWGSIVSPSDRCGATGLRPTFGSVSRAGAMTLAWSLDKAGPICRSAEDDAVVFNYLHGADGIDQCAVDRPFNYSGQVDWKKVRVGYAKNYFDRLPDTAQERKVLEVYRSLGAQIDPVTFPDRPQGAYPYNMMVLIIDAESAAAFDDFTRDHQDDQMTRQGRGDWPNTFRTSRFVPAVEYINANRHRYLLMQQMDSLFSQYDVVICPTFVGNQLAITNLTGHPALVFPTGFNARGLPTSITLIGQLYSEATLLAVGKAYQDATQWNKMHPEIFQ